MQPIRLIAGFLTVGIWTLLSRVLGFVRDILIAAYLGAGPVAEAFLIAFSLPNMFRRFFAEGAFNMAFVPMFSKKLEAGADPQGFAQDAAERQGGRGGRRRRVRRIGSPARRRQAAHSPSAEARTNPRPTSNAPQSREAPRAQARSR